MAIVRVNAGQAGPAGMADLAVALQGLAPGAPVAVLIHGYRYAPGHPRECPHLDLFARTDRHPRLPSWPRALGLDGGDGLAVCFGWPARGTLQGAYRRAGVAGAQLASVLEAMRTAAPGRRIALVGHSLGARVAISALGAARPGCVDLGLLLAPAELAGVALAPCGAEVICVDSAENRVFDLGFGLVMRAPTLARNLPQAPGWCALALDCPETLAGLERLGWPVAPAAARVCHWGVYSRPGTMALYRALIDGRLPVCALHDLGRGLQPPLPPSRRRWRWLPWATAPVTGPVA